MDTFNAHPENSTLTIDTVLEAARRIDRLPRSAGGPYRVIESEHMTKLVNYERGWGERLLSLPWQPLRKIGHRRVPREDVLLMEGGLVVAHPTIARRIHELAEVR